MATVPKSEAMDEGVVMMGEWGASSKRSRRLTMCGCLLFVIITVVELAALFQIGDSITALRIKLDPEFAAARLQDGQQPESWAMGSTSSSSSKKGFSPVSQRKPSLRSDALTKANAQLKEEKEQLQTSLAQVQEAFDKLQEQMAQMKLQGSEAATVQEREGRIRALEEELERVKMQKATEAGSKVAPYITLPKGTTGVKINVGANYRPLVECNPFETIVCFLFDIQNDPIQYLRDQYKDNSNTYIFTLGVSDYDGLAAFPTLGYGGEAQSTSLSDPNQDAGWNTGENRGHIDWSGVITLAHLIDSIDPEIPIMMLATDMQGHDFTAIVSAGDRLRRVQALQVELYKDGIATYAGVRNDYEADWLPYMTKMGFVEEICSPGYIVPGEANEWDCLWKPAV